MHYDISSSAVSQSNVGEYRIKPHEFKREDIIIYDIPESDIPFRIPGTKLGICTQKALNTNHTLDSDDLNALEQLVSSSIQEINAQLSTSSDTDYIDFSAELLPSSKFSHKENLQIINDLMRLRRVIREKTGFKESWNEVLYRAYAAVDVSGFGYHRNRQSEENNENFPVQTSGNEHSGEEFNNFGSPQAIGNNQYAEYDKGIDGKENNKNNFETLSTGEDNDENERMEEYTQSEHQTGNSTSGVRPRSPMRYADIEEQQLENLQNNEGDSEEQQKSEYKIPAVDPNDPKFEKLEKKYDEFYNVPSEKYIKNSQEAYDSEYRQDRCRGEMVHYDRDFVVINRNAIIGSNEQEEELAEYDNAYEDQHAGDYELQKRILAQQYAKQALDGNEEAYSKLRGLAENGPNYSTEQALQRVRQEYYDDGATDEYINNLPTNSEFQPLDEFTRQQIVDGLVAKIMDENELINVPGNVPERPKTERKVIGTTNCRIDNFDDLDEYEKISIPSRPDSKENNRTITTKEQLPPEPENLVRIQEDNVVFNANGLRTQSTNNLAGKIIVVPSVGEKLIKRIANDNEAVRKCEIMIEEEEVESTAGNFGQIFNQLADSIFLELYENQMTLTLTEAGKTIAQKTDIEVK